MHSNANHLSHLSNLKGHQTCILQERLVIHLLSKIRLDLHQIHHHLDLSQHRWHLEDQILHKHISVLLDRNHLVFRTCVLQTRPVDRRHQYLKLLDQDTIFLLIH